MATNRALAIPEILRAIAHQIPLFLHLNNDIRSMINGDDSSVMLGISLAIEQESIFVPRTLLNCCLVSRTWQQILLPVLWRCYDERLMGQVPLDLVLRYRMYFRYYRGYHLPLTSRELLLENENICAMNFVKTRDGERNPVETLDKTDNMDEDQCKSIVELDIFFYRKSGWGKIFNTVPPPAYGCLFRMNRHLSKICLVAHETKPQYFASRALSECLQLQELKILCFVTASSAKKDQGQQHDQEQICSDLGRFLSPVSHTLKHLTLLDIRGEYALDSLAPTLTETSVQSTLWFPHVVEFATDFSTKVSPGIEELIARCPNLEILRLSPHPTVSLEPLAAVLQRRRHDSINDIYNSAHHLKIHTLRIQSQTSEANQIHKVIEACENLTRLEYICNGLSEEIQKATNTHRSTLQHLKISVVFCHSVRNVSTWSLSKAERIAIGNAQIRYIQLITRSFTNLRSLAFQDAHQRSLEAEAAEILMETPWQCYNLERLHLAIELLEQEFEMDYPQPGRVFAHGWRIPMHVSVERTRVKPNYELFEQFLEHISPLPALRFIKALRVECVR